MSKAGLEDVVATSSAICYLDGDRGVLAYCGYDIHDLAQSATFEEVCHLLWHRRLPTRAELGDLQSQLAAARALPEPITRLMRSSVLQVKPNDYVQAARALGASPLRIINSHILPNSVASVIVVSTINLGVFISVEASLSFLGVGLQPPVISWGNMISDASGIGLIRVAPHMLLFPSLFLSLTVLSFIMLGDVVRDALDPRLR